VIDLHCHLLPGVDDGPETMRETVAMARIAIADGLETICCTPHVMSRYANTAARVEEGVARVREALAAAEVPLTVLPGAEISHHQVPRLGDEELRGLTLGGGGRWLLVEMPFRGWPLELPGLVRDLEIRGFGTILAHPERAESVQLAPDRMRDLIGRGALVQLTASSLTGEHGARARRTAESLLAAGMAHLLASDGHGAGWRPPMLSEGLARAADLLGRSREEVAWTVEAGPRLVVAGEPVRPPRLTPTRTPPAVATPGPLGRLRRKRRSS
jgi:protein-tyrosine phosphatase